MDPIYSRKWCSVDGTALEIPVGVASICFPLGFPNAGRINRLIFHQSYGTPVAFTIDLLDRQACVEYSENALDSSSSIPEPSGCPAGISKIIPTQTGDAGERIEVYEAHGYPYRNRESSFSDPTRLIYLSVKLDAAQNGDTLWDLSIIMEPQI